MSKMQSYILAELEKGNNLLKMQRELDSYQELSQEQIQEELDSDPAYQEFLDSLEDNPF